MVNTNSVLSSILFSQTIDWNIKQFFSSTSINSSFELKRIGKAITRRKDQMVVEDDKRYKRITIKTNCGGVFVRDEVLGNDSLVISLLSPLISLQNRQKCRFEPTLKKCSCNKASRAKKPYFKRLSAQTKRPETGTKRPEVDTLTKRLEIS